MLRLVVKDFLSLCLRNYYSLPHTQLCFFEAAIKKICKRVLKVKEASPSLSLLDTQCVMRRLALQAQIYVNMFP